MSTSDLNRLVKGRRSLAALGSHYQSSTELYAGYRTVDSNSACPGEQLHGTETLGAELNQGRCGPAHQMLSIVSTIQS
jgi:hypothetical protein